MSSTIRRTIFTGVALLSLYASDSRAWAQNGGLPPVTGVAAAGPAAGIAAIMPADAGGAIVRFIKVIGHGVVRDKPGEAHITFLVSTSNPSPVLALQDNAKQVSEVIKIMTARGVPEVNIKFSESTLINESRQPLGQMATGRVPATRLASVLRSAAADPAPTAPSDGTPVDTPDAGGSPPAGGTTGAPAGTTGAPAGGTTATPTGVTTGVQVQGPPAGGVPGPGPVIEPQPRPDSRYTANARIEVVTFDVTHASAIVQIGMFAGASGVLGMKFEPRNREDLEGRALILAMENAYSKAAILASGARAKILYPISETEMPSILPESVGISVAPPVEVVISMSVEMVYAVG